MPTADTNKNEGEADVNTIWEAIQDDEGRTYYYNTVTGESSWEAPPGFTGGAAASATGADEQAAEEQAAAAESDQPQRWTGYKDDEGRTYYYNETTGETQWERPEEGPNVTVVEEEDMEAEAEAEVEAEQRREGQQQKEQEHDASEPMEEGEYVAEGEDDGETAASSKATMGVEQVPEEVKDPKQVALEKAEAALTKTDAVMELGKSYIHACVQPWLIYLLITICIMPHPYLFFYIIFHAVCSWTVQTAWTMSPSSSISSVATSAVPRPCRR